MKEFRRYFAGLILLCAPQLAPGAAYPETYSMNEIIEKGVPPKLTKRIEPLVLVFPREGMSGFDIRHELMPGRITIDFIIDERGRVQNPRVVRSSGPWSEEAVTEAMAAWRFIPGKINGRPVRVVATEVLGTGETAKLVGQMEFSSRFAFGPATTLGSEARKSLPRELQWDKAPELCGASRAVYPRTDLQARKEGSVSIKYVVGPTGKVVAAEVLQATTTEMRLAALAALETWEFTPPSRNDNTPCSALLSARFRFNYFGADANVSEETRKMLRLLDGSGAKIAPVDQLDRPPKSVLARAPIYPATMLDRKEGGYAEVDLVIDVNGEVYLPVAVSSTTPEFGYAAVQAVATWRFDVPRVGGKAVVTRTRVRVDFPRPAAPAEKK